MTPRQRQNHPKPGEVIKSDPLRTMAEVKKVINAIKDRPRDLAMFTVGINTALRGSDLVALKKTDVAHLQVGDHMTVRVTKTGRLIQITINKAAYDAIQSMLEWDTESPWLFPSETTGEKMTRAYLGRLVKDWCKEAGLKGRFCSHTLRKTFGCIQYFHFKTPLSVISELLGHTDERVTRRYLCIQDEQVRDAFLNVIG